MFVEIIRNLILASVITYLVARLGIRSFPAAVGVSILLWIGFPAILLSGSVMWENVPWKLAAIHAGDWLVKLLLMAVILRIWH